MLGHLIESFLRQAYPRQLRELIILDDDGEYGDRSGDGWRIISVDRRFNSLGEKRNACAALASRDSEGFLVADDDDVFLPHWFSTHAEALKRAEWSRPSLVLIERANSLRQHPAGGLYHGNWAIRRDAFYRVRGYAALNNGEDQEFAHRLRMAKVSECDPCQFAPPFFICRFGHGGYHVSQMNDHKYNELETSTQSPRVDLQIGWPRDYSKLPVELWYDFGPKVISPQGGKRMVQLIRPILAPGRDDFSIGMHTLQKSLRQRIKGGLDWLEIKDLPAERGALAWFWHYTDRSYANWWNDQGQPFVQGPNMLFLNSDNPRIDLDENRLLDASNCKGMICLSTWYSDLINQHKGPSNTSTVFNCPYPIDVDPGGPTDIKYDLLIFSKNVHRPQLLEYLAEQFPRCILFHNGFQRGALLQAARSSRACVYLAENDHGSMILSEILLTGCPVVGVRNGAAFVDEGTTGLIVEQFPPGPKCFQSDRDSASLTQLRNAIRAAEEMSHERVRDAAMSTFGMEEATDRVLRLLDELRCT